MPILNPSNGTAAAKDVGISAGNVVQLDGSAKLPAVDGSQLINLPAAGGGASANNPALTGAATLVTGGAANTNALGIASNAVALGGQAGKFRTYFDQFGMLQTQGWMTISGLYNDPAYNPALGANQIEVIYPGGSKNSPTKYIGNSLNGFTGGMLGLSNDIVGPNLLSQDNQLTGGGQVTTGATVVAGGTGYVIGDVLTASGGTFTAATGTFYDGVVLPGTGYTVNDVVTISGGTGTAATVKVLTVNGSGGVLTATLLTNGNYSVEPPGTTFTTGGTGTGLYVNILWPSKGAASFTVASVSSGIITGLTVANAGLYTALPANPVALSGGTGTAATATVTWSGNAQQSRHVECLDYAKDIRFQIRGDGAHVWGRAQKIEDFVRSKANVYYVDDNTLASDATFKPAAINTAGDSQLGFSAKKSVTRTISATAGNTVSIGSFAFTDSIGGASTGFGALRIMVTTFGASWSVSKIYDLVTSYNLLAGAWATLVPVASNLQTGATNDFAVDASMSAGVLSLRLRTVAAGASATAIVSMRVSGRPGDCVFTPSTTTATGVATPPAYFPSKPPLQQDLVTKSIAVPVTSGTVTIGLGIPYQIINPTGTLAALTVMLPTGMIDGQKQTMVFSQAITTLFITPTGSSVQWTGGASVAQYQSLEFVYNAADFKWYRMR